MKKEYSFEEINNIIDKLSKKISKSNKFNCIALIGDLGTGKTTIAKRICKNLGVERIVKSPTFTYVMSYEAGSKTIHHFDVYRLSSSDELYEIGYDEYIGDKDSVTLIEWADNILDALPEDTITISLEYASMDTRYLDIKGEVC